MPPNASAGTQGRAGFASGGPTGRLLCPHPPTSSPGARALSCFARAWSHPMAPTNNLEQARRLEQPELAIARSLCQLLSQNGYGKKARKMPPEKKPWFNTQGTFTASSNPPFCAPTLCHPLNKNRISDEILRTLRLGCFCWSMLSKMFKLDLLSKYFFWHFSELIHGLRFGGVNQVYGLVFWALVIVFLVIVSEQCFFCIVWRHKHQQIESFDCVKDAQRRKSSSRFLGR